MLNEAFEAIDGFSIPVPVTLVCACACAYLLAKIPSGLDGGRQSSTNQGKTVCSKRLVGRLANELEHLREDLALHDESIQQLLDAITRLESGESQEISDQAAQTLRSIKQSATEFRQNFEAIQTTTATVVNTLMADETEGKPGATLSGNRTVQVAPLT